MEEVFAFRFQGSLSAMRTLEANENKSAEKTHTNKRDTQCLKQQRPRPCRHESPVSNEIQQYANKKAKKIDQRQVPECEHIKSPFLPYISFSTGRFFRYFL